MAGVCGQVTLIFNSALNTDAGLVFIQALGQCSQQWRGFIGIGVQSKLNG